MPDKKLSVIYGDEHIHFIRKTRVSDINKVLIKVHPDCSVVANAPIHASDKDVIDAVMKRVRWIHNKLVKFKEQKEHIVPRKYISGESHYYLGKQHLLKVVKVSGSKNNQVKLLRGKFEIHASNKNQVKDLLNAWYKDKAREVFNRRLDQLLPQTLWVQERPQIRIHTMKTQWGSCSPSGKLTLNPYLVKAPRDCIDYVILHELCHIVEHNHSERFYRYMGRVMPEWKSIKEKLDNWSGKFIH